MFKGVVFLKTVTSIMFVVIGFINLMYCIKSKANLKFPMLMVAGLICGMLGDILIVFNFYLGVVGFTAGHIIYFISYCMLEKTSRRDLIFGIKISAIALFVILFTPFLNFESTLIHGICCIYAIIISFMVGKAISNILKEKRLINIIIVIGSILFFISDFMLMLELFGNVSKALYLCLVTYYPAQFILAFSIFVYASINLSKQKKEMV